MHANDHLEWVATSWQKIKSHIIIIILGLPGTGSGIWGIEVHNHLRKVPAAIYHNLRTFDCLPIMLCMHLYTALHDFLRII